MEIVKPFKADAHINSLNGKIDEITVLKVIGDICTSWTTKALNAPQFLTGMSALTTRMTFTE